MKTFSKLLLLSSITLTSSFIHAEGYKFVSTLLTTPYELAESDACAPKCPLLKIYIIDTDYPVVNQAINDYIVDLVDSFNFDDKEEIQYKYDPDNVDALVKTVYDFFKKEDEKFKDFNGNSYVSINTTFLGKHKDVMMYSTVNDSYILGAAHGNSNQKLFNYDTEKKKILSIKDIIKPEAVETVKSIARKNFLKNSSNNKIDPDIARNTEFFLSENFEFNSDGIIFSYNPYELLPYVFGPQRVFLSYDEIKEYLKPEYLPNKS